MGRLSKHDQIAKNIADKKGTEYHSDKGVDVRTPTQAIEVEVDAKTLKDGIRQLQGTNKARYLQYPMSWCLMLWRPRRTRASES